MLPVTPAPTSKGMSTDFLPKISASIPKVRTPNIIPKKYNVWAKPTNDSFSHTRSKSPKSNQF